MATAQFSTEHARYTIDVAATARDQPSPSTDVRERRAVERFFHEFAAFLSSRSPADVAALLAPFETRDVQTDEPETESALAARLSGAELGSDSDRMALEVGNMQRAYALRTTVLADSLSSTQVARLLGTSRQTPHDRVRAGTLLGVFDRGSWRFPRWQFDPNGPNGVLSGLTAILRTLQGSDLARASWCMRPNPYLDGQPPLAKLRAGDVARVLDAAQLVSRS